MLDTSRYMQDPERLQRRTSAGERELLERFLDFQRDTLIWKLSGLTREQLTTPRTPSGLSLLGVAKHLGYVERSWFQRRFMGRDVFIRDGAALAQPSAARCSLSNWTSSTATHAAWTT